MLELLSVQDAASALDLSPNRIRALVGRGQLPALKVGGRWVIERAAVEARRREASGSGRPFEPHNAWALLLLASGKQVEGIDPSVRSRLRRALAMEGLEKLRPRLVRRAESRFLSAHPGELLHLADDAALVRSGISAAASYGIDLVSGSEADGYLAADALKRFESAHALSRSDRASSNVRLRLVPAPAWRLASRGDVAPIAALALDLAEDPDPRSARAGQSLLREIDDAIRS
jgi:excisionase family DNA binding protein